MFEITIQGKVINVNDHIPFLDYLEERGLPWENLGKINYFTWAALPELSQGRFLIWEYEWRRLGISSAGSGVASSLKIIDEKNTVTFTNLTISDVSFVQSSNKEESLVDPTSASDLTQGKRNGRLMIMTLTLDRYVNSKNQVETQGMADGQGEVTVDYGTLTDEFSDLVPGPDIIPFESGDVPHSDRPMFHTWEQNRDQFRAYIAHVHFLTAYYPKVGDTDTNPILTRELCNLTDYYPDEQLLHNRVTMNQKGIEFKYFFRDHLYRFVNPETEEQYKSALKTSLTNPESYFYLSDPAKTVDRDDNLYFYYPFYIVKPEDTYQSALDGIASAGLINAATRFQRNFDLWYSRVIDITLGNDLQRVTYQYSELGITTRLETIPWKPWNPYNLPDPRITITDVVKIVSEEKDENGFMEGIIQRYDSETFEWVDTGSCKVLDSNA